jgi:AhpC/TSA family
MKMIASGITVFAFGWLVLGAGPSASAQDTPPAEEEAQVQEEAKQDEAKQEEAPVPPDTFQLIVEEFQKATADFNKKMSEVEDAAERRKIMVDRPMPDKYAERMMAVAEKDLASEEGRQALGWIAANCNGEPSTLAFEKLVEHHPDANELGSFAQKLSRSMPTGEVMAQFDAIAEKTGSDRNKAIALWMRTTCLKNGIRGWTAYADIAKNLADMSDDEFARESRGRTREQVEEQVKSFQSQFPESVREMYADPVAFEAKMLESLEEILAKYGEVRMTDAEDSPTLASRLENEIFELKYLTIGKEAPDIEGEDLDGTAFKLSEYRGKVVVIDFWGDW